MTTTQNTTDNPLATGNINQLMIKFAVPSIIAMMVSAVYNIADQLFIGNAVGTLGNAATNIAFPLSMMCTAIALMFGIGGASSFNLHMGAGESQKAPYFLGNSITMLLGLGAILFIGTELFLDPMLKCFGSPDNVLPLAKQYVSITAIGFPFLIITIGGGHLIRADGSPKMTMICNLSGAIINIVLDALFVLVLRWGMVGAALATIIGQIFSAFLALNYLRHYRTVTIEKKHLRPQTIYLKRIMALGMASCFNQIAMMTVQICMNNLLKHYGSLSQYGEAIPIACAGIVMKVGQLYFSIVIGLSQGSQPIESFNYGARQYKRVKAAYRYAMIAGGTVSVIAFVIFQLFPHQLLALFGNGSKEYFEFGSFYFRIFMLMAWANFMQPISSTFFTSIGKANKGTFLSLTRQIIFLLPLMFFLPTIFGIKGILYAAPIADGMAFVTAAVMVWSEMRAMK
ncbi:MATE family efflux transporter [Jutongia hominis]|uniref:Multidrug export protein MepA n=1 Tax=Jutongia hominis TaxID=2763664 RepID=A0ABR7MRK3_9FIRM|nr:MATE family efflux transporter [Jutongia hominis]MBC8556416.1 MATE family efflux transporter [Jutongia hominis]